MISLLHSIRFNAYLTQKLITKLSAQRFFSDSIHSNINKRIKKNKLIISEVIQEQWEFAKVKHLSSSQYLKAIDGLGEESFKKSPFVILDVRALDEDMYEPLPTKNSVNFIQII